MDFRTEQQAQVHLGRFIFHLSNTMAGKITDARLGRSRNIFNHYEGGNAWRQPGAGKELLHAGVTFALRKGNETLSLSPFAKKIKQSDAAPAKVLV
jgi:predicted GNAT family acetyltransferase